MAVKFNPFTGQLQIDQVGAGGGGGASYIDGEVATYNDLPLDGTAALNSAWLVRTASGVWPVSRKQAGIYIRTATAGSSRDADYTYAGTMPDVFSDAQFTLYDDADTTKNVKFNVGANVPTGNTVTLTAPASSGTLALGNQSVNDTDSPSFLGIYVGTNAANATNIGEVTITSSGLALSMEEPNGGQVSMRWFSPATTGDGNHWGFGCDTLNTNENNFFVWDFINNRPALWTNGDTGNVVFGGEYAEGTLPAKVQVIGISPSTATLLGLDNKTAGAVAQKIRAAVSQSANLSEWMDSSGNLLLSVNSSGNLVLYDNVGGANTATFTASSQLTGNRSYNCPDASGTLALTSDIPALGTGAGEAAEGNHTHELTALAATGATNGHVLTANGSNGVTFAALPASGVTGAASSASDVLGVSGANITGVDAGSADRLVFWDDSANKLTYLEAGSGLSISGTTLTATATGTIGGSTSTDNAIVRADSTSNTVQDSALVIDDATTSTQANVAVVNAHSETNSALVLTPKGTGAFIVGPKPDGTSTGGNARGANAVDIQTGDRSGATQVASGSQSVAVGTRCIASGSSAVAIGRASTASGNDSIALRGSASNAQSIAIGASSSATSIVSIAIGNQANCTGQNAVAIGYDPDATAQSAVAIGVVASATAIAATSIIAPASLRAQFATLPFSAVYWSGQTTNNTATILNLDAAATNRFTIAASTALAVDILLVARRSDVADKWLVARRFLGIRRDGSNNTSLIGSVQTLGTDQSAGSPSWTFALTADDTNEALQLEVTGATGETVQWRATAIYRVV